MNPVLLKPGSDTRSQVVLLGQPVAEAGALDYQELKPVLPGRGRREPRGPAPPVRRGDLRGRGQPGRDQPAAPGHREHGIGPGGGPAGGGRRGHRPGRAARRHVRDAGGAGAGRPAAHRRVHRQQVPRRPAAARPRPRHAPGDDGPAPFGVLPWRHDLWLDAEDSLDLDSRPRAAPPPRGAGTLRIAVVRLPRMSNVTDVDPLAAEPGVIVDLASTPAQLDGADLVIAAGDPGYRQRPGLAARQRPRRGHRRPGRDTAARCSASAAATRCSPARSSDDVESRAGTVTGARPAACHGQVRRAPRRSPGRPGAALGELSAATRSTTGWSPGTGRGLPRWVRGGQPSGAPPGMASSTMTASGGRSCAIWPTAPGGTFTAAPDVSFAAVGSAVTTCSRT